MTQSPEPAADQESDKLFFIKQENRPDWYRLVRAPRTGRPPKDAVLELENFNIDFQRFGAEGLDRKSLVLPAIYQSVSIKKALTIKIALRLAEHPEMATTIRDWFLDMEFKFRKQNLLPGVRVRLARHFLPDEVDMSDDRLYLQTLEPQNFVKPDAAKIFDEGIVVINDILRVMQSGKDAEIKKNRIDELLQSKNLYIGWLPVLAKFCNVYYGDPMNPPGQEKEIDKRFYLNLPGLLMKHWNEAGKLPNGKFLDAIFISNDQERLFYFRREFVEQKMQAKPVIQPPV